MVATDASVVSMGVYSSFAFSRTALLASWAISSAYLGEGEGEGVGGGEGEGEGESQGEDEGESWARGVLEMRGGARQLGEQPRRCRSAHEQGERPVDTAEGDGAAREDTLGGKGEGGLEGARTAGAFHLW